MQLFSSFTWIRRFAPGFAIFSVALLIMVPLAACGGSSSSSTSSTSTGPVNLTFWSWVSGADKSVALWNQTHPNIQVKWSNVGSGPVEYNKLFTAIKANNEPDVGQIEFQVTPQFETTGALVDLSPYGVSSLKSQFAPWTWNQMSLGNAVYGIPGDTGPWPCTTGPISSRSIISRCPPPGPSMPTMRRNCRLPTRMRTSPTSHPGNQDGSPGWSGRQAHARSASMANPGKCPSITLRPYRSPPTGKL